MSASASQQSWVDVAVFEDVNDAKAIESFLIKKRLEARVCRENFLRVFMFLHPPRVTHHVRVRHNSLKCAGDFLEAGAPEALQRALRCPACHSLHVAYPQLARPSVPATLLMHLGLIFHVMEHKCRCERCHCSWSLPGQNINPATAHAGGSAG